MKGLAEKALANGTHVAVIEAGQNIREGNISIACIQPGNPGTEAENGEYVFISAGRKNRYGHPHQETIVRFADVGCKIYSTQENGALIVEVEGGETMKIGCVESDPRVIKSHPRSEF